MYLLEVEVEAAFWGWFKCPRLTSAISFGKIQILSELTLGNI